MNIKLIPEKLILPSGESRKIMLEIMSPQKEGSFKGKVYFTGKNEDRKGDIHHLKAELIFEIGEKSKEQEGNLPQIPQKFILK